MAAAGVQQQLYKTDLEFFVWTSGELSKNSHDEQANSNTKVPLPTWPSLLNPCCRYILLNSTKDDARRASNDNILVKREAEIIKRP